MKTLIVISGLDPASGGPTRSCKGLCRALSQAGVDVTLYVLHEHHAFEDACGVKVVYASDTPLRAYLTEISRFSLVHLQGLWDPCLHQIVVACYKANIPYVISPRGMLDPWALSVKKWKKWLALLLYQRKDLKRATAFHVTAEMEKAHVRALGFTQHCFIAPNGVEMPTELPRPQVPWKDGLRTAIFLSRLHPGKGLLTLAEAWARVKPQNWIMRIVGPDSYGHKAEVLAKLDALGIRDQWIFEGAKNDVDKWQAYREAEVLIHPSVSENFGITIAEALYAGLPVIATKGTPWKDLVDYNCGWWIDQGVDALSVALSQMFGCSTAQLKEMGVNGHKLVKEKYIWPAVAKAMVQGYESVLKGESER